MFRHAEHKNATRSDPDEDVGADGSLGFVYETAEMVFLHARSQCLEKVQFRPFVSQRLVAHQPRQKSMSPDSRLRGLKDAPLASSTLNHVKRRQAALELQRTVGRLLCS